MRTVADAPRSAPGVARQAVLAVAALVGALGCSAPSYRGPASPHFDGERFANDPPAHQVDVLDLLRWQVHADPIPWPAWVDWPSGKGPTVPAPFEGDDEVRVTFVNHSTLLVQMAGMNILTDPVWSSRVGPTSWLGPKRHHDPGIRFDDLPHIDAVVLSHDHFDHLDLPTLARLAARDAPLTIAGLGTGELLEEAKVGPYAELDWWACTKIREVRICALPAQHNGRRGLTDGNRRLWASFWIESRAGSVYFAGDTGFGPHFEAIRARMGRPCVALLPIGAYRPRWVMKNNHLDPADAVRAHDILGARQSIGMHFATFEQTDEGMYQPAGELGLALAASGQHAPFLAPDFGQVVTTRCPAADQVR